MSREVFLRELFDETITGEWGVDPKSSDNTKVLRSVNFRNDGKIDFNDVAERYLTKKDLDRKSISRGNILFEKSGGSPSQPAGRIVFCSTEFKGSCSNFIEIGRVSDKYDELYVFYLLFHFYHSGKVLKYQQQTTGIINFKLGEYLDVEKASIPSLKTEQSKIAEILSTIDKAIDQTEAMIAKQQRIKNGLMQDLLTKGIDEHGNLRSEETHEFKDSELGRVPKEWNVKSLSSLTSLISSGVTPRGGYKIYQKEGIPFIRSQNVYPYGIITEDIVFISDEIHDSMPRTKVQNSDVLLNITGASIGRCCQVPKGFPESNVNQHVCIIRLNNNSDEYSKFIATFLASDFGQRQIFNQMAGGNREGLNFDEIGRFYVPEINDKEAERITDSIEKIEKSIAILQKENNKLKRQKSGLMQDLLTGKVLVEELINTPN